MAKSINFVDTLSDYAWKYINECLENKKHTLSNKGTIEEVPDRHIPTVDYFLKIWIPLNYSKKDTIKRSTYYRWLNWDNTYKQRIIKDIDETFKALATDIVANEGKGIFYAKNKLGMTDKTENKTDIKIEPITGMEIL
jgi:uncharacterized protein YaaR (DUF327 family)